MGIHFNNKTDNQKLKDGGILLILNKNDVEEKHNYYIYCCNSYVFFNQFLSFYEHFVSKEGFYSLDGLSKVKSISDIWYHISLNLIYIFGYFSSLSPCLSFWLSFLLSI